MAPFADRNELYALVENLPPAELRRILRLIVGELSATEDAYKGPRLARRQAPRQLSIFGSIEDDPDAARRSEEHVRQRFTGTE